MQVTNLRSYLAEKNMTLREFSEKLEYTYVYVSRVASGKVKPSARMIRDINKLTEGVVDLKRPSVK
jgi:transcriptional regulator with XRE-family HTH domain